MKRLLIVCALALMLALPSLAAASGHVTWIRTYNPAAGEFPEGIAVDKQGNIFVTMAPIGQIRKISPQGTETLFHQFPAGAAADRLGGGRSGQRLRRRFCAGSRSRRGLAHRSGWRVRLAPAGNREDLLAQWPGFRQAGQSLRNRHLCAELPAAGRRHLAYSPPSAKPNFGFRTRPFWVDWAGFPATHRWGPTASPSATTASMSPARRRA